MCSKHLASVCPLLVNETSTWFNTALNDQCVPFYSTVYQYIAHSVTLQNTERIVQVFCDTNTM